MICQYYEKIKEAYQSSNIQREKDKAKNASDMLKKLKNKKLFLQNAGTVDIYKVLSQLVCEMQIVNLLPHERYDKFLKQMDRLQNMISTVDENSSCAELCLWKMLHSDSNCILGGDLGSIKLTLSEPEVLVFTRSVITQTQANQEKSMEEKTYLELKHFVEDLKKELTDMFREKNKEIIEVTRNLTDWKLLALQVKARGSPLLYLLLKIIFF